MKNRASVSLLLAIALAACASPEEPPPAYVPASRYEPETSPQPAAAASDGGLADSGATDEVRRAANAIATAHCKRMARCERLNGDQAQAACTARVSEAALTGLVKAGCRSIDAAELDQCVRHLQFDACDGVLPRVKRILVCRHEELCGPAE